MKMRYMEVNVALGVKHLIIALLVTKGLSANGPQRMRFNP